MRKIFFAIVFIVIGILNVCMLVLLPINAAKVSKTMHSGYVQIKVLEAATLKPVANATVCIIENSHYTTTNSHGETPKIQVPVLRNANYDNILLKNWGELSILIYKPGYADYISFYNEVYAGVTRIGLVCYLMPAGSESITTNANTPNSAYTNTLIAHYKK